MTTQQRCKQCGGARTATDPADVCLSCSSAPKDWAEPHAANPIDDDDELVVENAHRVTPDPASH